MFNTTEVFSLFDNILQKKCQPEQIVDVSFYLNE